jgi:VWFA-related protein
VTRANVSSRRLTAVLLLFGTFGAVLAGQQSPPKFSSSVDLTSIDAIVVDDRGRPIQDLGPNDFTVRIDDKVRRVVSAEWVPLAAEAKRPVIGVPEGYSSNENASGGRLIVIAVDQPNIRFGANLTINKTASNFLDRLTPADRVSVVGFGAGAAATPFTADRKRVKAALARMTGQRQSQRSSFSHQMSVSEAQAIARGDDLTLSVVQLRECANLSRLAADVCRTELQSQAQEMVELQTHEAVQTITGLRDLLTSLMAIEAPKTLILISEGFVLDDPGLVTDLGNLAMAARTSVYALRLDRDAFDITEAHPGVDPVGDRQTMISGLETLTGAARGAVFTVTNSGAPLFARIESELSGYYLLGVESDPADRDPRPHPVRVDVTRRGVIVRTRRQFLYSVAAAARNPRDAVTVGLSSPLLLSALPLRVATYSLRGPEAGRIQLLIHADIGAEYTASQPVSIGFMLFDAAGKLVDSQAIDRRLAPIVNGVPSPLQFTGGASVPPGDYILKLAAAEGDKVGSVEHAVHAALASGGPVSVSDLTVGGPADGGEPLRPTVGYTISYGTVHGYVEAYGADLGGVSATFEIAKSADGPALLNAPVPPRTAGDSRALFSKTIPVQQLPAGKYVLRATVRRGTDTLAKLTRPFEVAPPPVLLTSAMPDGEAKSVDAELFLPVTENALGRPFAKDAALRPETLDPFTARVAPAVRPSFDAGIGFIAAGDYIQAERMLKKAIQPDLDSTPALAYLAVCFAASGHDQEAASAFQTALVDGSDVPQLYEWLGEALLRTHDLAEARSVFEEAAGKWPSDPRFTRPLAMLYATFGRGREAVRTLERYLDTHGDDGEALSLAVEWIYHVHAAGGVVHDRAQDVQLAHTYADAYAKTGGPQAALVRQWLDFLDSEKK